MDKDLEKKLFKTPVGPNSDSRVSQTQKRILQAKLERGEAADAPANVNPKWFKFRKAARSHLARLRPQVAACMVDLHAETLSERDLSALVDDVVGPPSDVGFFLLVDYLGYPVAHVMVLYEKREHLLEWRISSFYVEPAFRKQGYFCMFFYYLRDLAMNENLPGNALRLCIPFDEVKNQETFLDPRTINTWRGMAVRRRRAKHATPAGVMQPEARDTHPKSPRSSPTQSIITFTDRSECGTRCHSDSVSTSASRCSYENMGSPNGGGEYSPKERAIPSGGLRRGDLEEWWTYDLPELRSDGTGAIANEADAAMPESVFISHTNAQSVIDENLDNLDVCPVAFQGDGGEEYDLEHALMVLPDLKMMELEPNNALQQCQSDIKSAHMDFEANESLVRWHSYQQFDEPVKDDDADDQVYALPTLEELEQQLMALPHLQMRRLETQDCQQSERAFQPQQSNGGEPNVGGSDGVSNQSKIQQHQAANRLWERPQSAMYNTNDIDGDEDDETHNLPRSQELETQPALIPYPQATGLETIPEEHQLYELWDARSSVLMASQRKRLGRIDPTEYDDKDGDGLYELPEL